MLKVRENTPLYSVINWPQALFVPYASVQSVSPCERLVSILGRFCSYYAEVFFMSTRKAVRYSVDIASVVRLAAIYGDNISQRSSSNCNLEVVVFEERGKPEYPEKNLSEQGREPTTYSTRKWTPSLGFEPKPHWWEASALPLCYPCSPQMKHIILLTCGRLDQLQPRTILKNKWMHFF